MKGGRKEGEGRLKGGRRKRERREKEGRREEEGRERERNGKKVHQHTVHKESETESLQYQRSA